MGLINRSKAQEAGVEPTNSSGSDTSPIRDKNEVQYGGAVVDHHAHLDDMTDPSTRLHRGLKARQVTMIAIGGAM